MRKRIFLSFFIDLYSVLYCITIYFALISFVAINRALAFYRIYCSFVYLLIMEYNMKDVTSVLVDISDKYSGMLKEAKCSDPRLLKKELLLNQNKEVLAKWVLDFTAVLARSQQVLRNVSGKFDEMKDTIISLQSTKIQNQEQLLEVKQQSIDGFQSALRSEMKSYRDVAFENVQPVVSSANIEPAVKKAVQDGERSKNVILFGVKESEDEEVESAVTNIL